MLGCAPRDAFAPHAEARGLEFAAHEFDYICFAEAGFFMNFVKGRSILPCHAYDLIGFGFRHIALM